jgi:mono/diheme cytochrome c family protein
MHRTIKFALLLVFAAIPFAGAQTKAPPVAGRKVDYKQDIQPLLSQHCYSCHGPEVQQAGLRLDLRQNALRGGDYGPVIKIGDSAGSKLIRRLVDGDGGLQMPPAGALSNDEIGLLRAWIDQGAEFRTDIVTEAPRKLVDPKVTALIAAVRAGQRSEIERQIAANPEVIKGTDAGGSTALHHAAGYGPLDNLQSLIDKGADVNAKNRRGSTPLHWAIHDEAKARLHQWQCARRAVADREGGGRQSHIEAQRNGAGLRGHIGCPGIGRDVARQRPGCECPQLPRILAPDVRRQLGRPARRNYQVASGQGRRHQLHGRLR